jgi:hypothetical protein
MTSGGLQDSTGTHLPFTSVVSCGQTQVLGAAPVTIGGGQPQIAPGMGTSGGGQVQIPSTFMTCGGGHTSLH